MEWDAESFVPPTSAIVNKWDGEDEEEVVKDNWEDDEEDKKKEDQSKKTSAQSKKPKSRLEEKIEERERKEIERRQKTKAQLTDDFDETDMTPEQIQAEKLRRQKLQEESDFEVAKEMLGLTDEELSVDRFNPKTKEEFVEFKDALCKKILLYKKSDYFPFFVEEFVRDISANLSSNELRKLKLNMDNMFNEKVRVEKGEKGKKSKGKGKAKLRVEGSDLAYDEYSAYTIDEYDDFM